MTDILKNNFPLCQIKAKGWIHIGFLYLENKNVVVLLNDIPSGVDLGPLKLIRDKHTIPEAHITIIPRETIDNIFMVK